MSKIVPKHSPYICMFWLTSCSTTAQTKYFLVLTFDPSGAVEYAVLD